MSRTFEVTKKEIDNKLDSLKSQVSELNGQVSLLEKQIKDSTIYLAELSDKKMTYQKAVELLTLLQQESKIYIKEGLEKIITYALQYVYDSDYAFELEYDRRGNFQEVNFNIKSPGCKETKDLEESEAGGILNVFSLALRIAILELSRPKLRGFLVLDESFENVSKGKLANVAKFLKAINEKINRQIILVTHKDELISGDNNLIEIK